MIIILINMLMRTVLVGEKQLIYRQNSIRRSLMNHFKHSCASRVIARLAGAWGLVLVAALVVAGSTSEALAQDKVINLYSARHYQTDEALYTNFTNATGIKGNRIEGGEDELIERIKNGGQKSPAEWLIRGDVGVLCGA